MHVSTHHNPLPQPPLPVSHNPTTPPPLLPIINLGIKSLFVTGHQPGVLQSTKTRLRHSLEQYGLTVPVTPGRPGYDRNGLIPYHLRHAKWCRITLRDHASSLHEASSSSLGEKSKGKCDWCPCTCGLMNPSPPAPSHIRITNSRPLRDMTYMLSRYGAHGIHDTVTQILVDEVTSGEGELRNMLPCVTSTWYRDQHGQRDGKGDTKTSAFFGLETIPQPVSTASTHPFLKSHSNHSGGKRYRTRDVMCHDDVMVPQLSRHQRSHLTLTHHCQREDGDMETCGCMRMSRPVFPPQHQYTMNALMYTGRVVTADTVATSKSRYQASRGSRAESMNGDGGELNAMSTGASMIRLVDDTVSGDSNSVDTIKI